MTSKIPADGLSVGEWLSDLQRAAGQPRLGRGGARFTELASREPEFASYASVGEIAERIGIHRSSITRIAQVLGFSGWPGLRSALRTVYLDSPLRGQYSPMPDTRVAGLLAHNVKNIEALGHPTAQESIAAIAASIRSSRRTIVVGSGQAAIPGTVLSHFGTLGGIDIRLSVEPNTNQIALASNLDRNDFLIGISVWRMTKALYEVIRIAHERGATTALLTDAPGSRLGPMVDHLLYVPSTSGSIFPSTVPMVTAAQLIFERAAGATTVTRVHEVERLWDAASLMDDHD